MIDYLTKEEYKSHLDKYYDMARWDYYSPVIEMIKKLELQDSESVLELGCRKFSLVKNCHTMDIEWSPTYLYDAKKTPWPFEDKKYKLVVGLQVFEHLGDAQSKVFNEVMRVADYAILSFPLMWQCPKDPVHHGISLEKIAEWTNHCKPVESLFVKNVRAKCKNRIIQAFDFALDFPSESLKITV